MAASSTARWRRYNLGEDIERGVYAVGITHLLLCNVAGAQTAFQHAQYCAPEAGPVAAVLNLTTKRA